MNQYSLWTKTSEKPWFLRARPFAATVATVRSRPYRNPPPFRVMPVCFHGNEKAAPDQNFGRFQRALSIIPEGAWSKALNVSHADDGLLPAVLQPTE
jgi:hypothetical protein